jgi:hypothetical protein
VHNGSGTHHGFLFRRLVTQRTNSCTPGTHTAPSAFKIQRRGLQLTLIPSNARGHGARIFVCNGTFDMRTERFEGKHEATKALALAGAGVMVAMLMWILMMLLFY